MLSLLSTQCLSLTGLHVPLEASAKSPADVIIETTDNNKKTIRNVKVY